MIKLAIVPVSQPDPMPSPSENPIGDYILRVMEEENLRPVDVLANAKKLKIKLRQATLAEVYSGQVKNPGIFTLVKISRALGRPFDEMVREIEGSSSVNSAAFKAGEFAVLFHMYQQLASTKDKRHADRLLEMIKREFSELLSSNVSQI